MTAPSQTANDRQQLENHLQRLAEGLLVIAEKFSDGKQWNAADRMILAEVLHRRHSGPAGILDVGRGCIRIAERLQNQVKLTEQDLDLLGELIHLAQIQALTRHDSFKRERAAVERWTKKTQGQPSDAELAQLQELEQLRLRDALRDPDHHPHERVK